LTRAFALADSVQPIRDRLRQSNVRDWREAHRRGAITDAQAAQLEAAEATVLKVLQVDDFAPEALTPRGEGAPVRGQEQELQPEPPQQPQQQEDEPPAAAKPAETP